MAEEKTFVHSTRHKGEAVWLFGAKGGREFLHRRKSLRKLAGDERGSYPKRERGN